jgi:hypothetical protein
MLREFADAVINRSEKEIHDAVTALEGHFSGATKAVEAEVAKVEEMPAAILSKAKGKVATATAEVEAPVVGDQG